MRIHTMNFLLENYCYLSCHSCIEEVELASNEPITMYNFYFYFLFLSSNRK